MCGVFGIHNHHEAANLAYLGLHALQHRGQESAGVVTNDGGTLHAVRKMGHVADIFDQATIAQLRGNSAIGHVRYSTAGGSLPKNVQPLSVELRHGPLAIAHNGNLVNADLLRSELEESGSIFSSNADTEVIVHLMARSGEREALGRLAHALNRVRGAYSLVMLAGGTLFAARDPHGFRPLMLGRVVGEKTSWVVASESVAFDLIDAEFVRDVKPGEILAIDENGLRSTQSRAPAARACVFEYVYFARPDSVLDGASVYDARVKMGEALAAEHPVAADVVIPVPDSGVVAAMGYAKASRIDFAMGLIRNHYVGRTFIEPKASIRHFGVKLKLNPVPRLLAGKRVVVVDDSIVRGTTSRKIVQMIRDAGASEVHVRISSPPVTGSCYYGIDTPTREELVAAQHDIPQTRDYIGADSLAYLTAASLQQAVSEVGQSGLCTACFTGEYPVPVERPPTRRQLRLIEL